MGAIVNRPHLRTPFRATAGRRTQEFNALIIPTWESTSPGSFEFSASIVPSMFPALDFLLAPRGAFNMVRLLGLTFEWVPRSGMAEPGTVAFALDPQRRTEESFRSFNSIIQAKNPYTNVRPIYHQGRILAWRPDASYAAPVDVQEHPAAFSQLAVPILFIAFDSVHITEAVTQTLGRVRVTARVELSDEVIPEAPGASTVLTAVQHDATSPPTLLSAAPTRLVSGCDPSA